MSKLRLKIDLTDFYSDHRSKAYVCIRPEYAKVKCLEEYIKKIFNLTGIAMTSSDGIYFPPEESIDILEANDILKVIALPTGTVSAVSEKPKKKKKKEKVLQIEHDHVNEVHLRSNVYASGGINVSEIDKDLISKRSCRDVSLKDVSNPDQSLSNIEESISSTTVKRKRKRIRKKNTEVTSSPLRNTKISKEPPSIPHPQTGNKHIRFDETNNAAKCSPNDNDDDVEKAPIIKWTNILDKVNKSIPRIIHAKVINRLCTKDIGNVEAPNFVAINDTKIANPNEVSDEQNTFLKENGNSENWSANNGREISCC